MVKKPPIMGLDLRVDLQQKIFPHIPRQISTGKYVEKDPLPHS